MKKDSLEIALHKYSQLIFDKYPKAINEAVIVISMTNGVETSGHLQANKQTNKKNLDLTLEPYTKLPQMDQTKCKT